MRSRARLLFYAIMVAGVFVIARVSAAPADEPPVVTTTVSEPVDVMVEGRTAAQWHRVAGRYLRSVRALNHVVPPWGSSWLEGAFFCIHSFEGRWSDSGAPYWGGLQMDYGFQRSYGGWALRAFGTADHWPVSVQIAVAIRAKVSGRGFYAWPNTARYCGLI